MPKHDFASKTKLKAPNVFRYFYDPMITCSFFYFEERRAQLKRPIIYIVLKTSIHNYIIYIESKKLKEGGGL